MRQRRDREGQFGALGLVVNIIVLWNMIHVDAALEQFRAEGCSVRAEDIARLSPLVYEHINLLGSRLDLKREFSVHCGYDIQPLILLRK